MVEGNGKTDVQGWKEAMMWRNNGSAAFIVALITKRHPVTLVKHYYKLKQ